MASICASGTLSESKGWDVPLYAIDRKCYPWWMGIMMMIRMVLVMRMLIREEKIGNMTGGKSWGWGWGAAKTEVLSIMNKRCPSSSGSSPSNRVWSIVMDSIWSIISIVKNDPIVQLYRESKKWWSLTWEHPSPHHTCKKRVIPVIYHRNFFGFSAKF